MKFPASILVLLILFHNPSVVLSARVLAVLLSSAPSHHFGMFQPLLKALVESGHQVVAYTPRPLDNPPANYTNVFLEEFLENEDSEILEVIKKHYMKFWDNFGPRSLEWLDIFMSSKEIQTLLTSKERYDLIIVEPFLMQEFTVILGKIFNAPVVGLSTMTSFDYLNSVVGNPLELAYIPDISAPRTDNMSFMDRVYNALEISRRLFYYHLYTLPSLETKMRGYFPQMPPLLEMMRGLSLVFINEHPTVSFARPHLPNVIPVGGLHIGATDAKPLPQDIQSFIDGAQEGFILFSFGSLLPEQVNSEKFYDIFKDVFGRLKVRVLWKIRRTFEGVPNNVKTVSWLPQQEVLAHKNCKLFITHGGIHSLFEAVHFGIPMISIPYFADQNSNAMFCEAKGIGMMIDRHSISREKLFTSINTSLEDPSFARNAAKLSLVYRDRPLTPAQSVVYWVNHVLRHGSSHLRPPPPPFGLDYPRDVIFGLTGLALLALLYAALTYLVKYQTAGRLLLGKKVNLED